VDNSVAYFQHALFLTFGDSPEAQREISACQTPADIVDFCVGYKKETLYIIADQYNALEESTNISAEKKTEAKTLIQGCAFGHILLLGFSANNETARFVGTAQRSVRNFKMFGGFSEVRSFFLACVCVL
jgi:hypothetical protein